MFAGKPNRKSCRLYVRVIDSESKALLHHAEVFVDGRPVGDRRNEHGVFALMVSQHVPTEVLARAENYWPGKDLVDVDGVGSIRLVIELQPIPPAAEAWIA